MQSLNRFSARVRPTLGTERRNDPDDRGCFWPTYEGVVRGLGADEDRVLDQRHATLLGACAKWLETQGWEVVAEVSYSQWGERGSIDLLAWHAITRSLLVIEIKSELASIEATVRKLDEKARLAPGIARTLGWSARSVSRLLVLPDDRTQRRRVLAHAAVLSRAYPVRSRGLRAWCRAPVRAVAGLLFLTNSSHQDRMVGKGRRARVRLPSQGGAEHDAGRSTVDSAPAEARIRP